MAKKAKTPPPPRRVQAPKQRTQARDPRRTRMLLYAAAAAGFVALAAVVGVMALGGGSSSEDLAASFERAGCTFRTVDAAVPQGQATHVSSLTAKIDWNTSPPSNGQHNPSWGVWGFYTEPVNPRLVVHNLEHGGIVLWWGPQTPQAQVDALHELYSDSPESMFGTPIAGLGSKVAISAWTGDPARYGRDDYHGEGHVAVCPRYDERAADAFRAFRDAYRGEGPEGIPASQNQPGTGP